MEKGKDRAQVDLERKSHKKWFTQKVPRAPISKVQNVGMGVFFKSILIISNSIDDNL